MIIDDNTLIWSMDEANEEKLESWILKEKYFLFNEKRKPPWMLTQPTRFVKRIRDSKKKTLDDRDVWTTRNFSFFSFKLFHFPTKHFPIKKLFRLLRNSFNKNFDAFTECCFTFRNQYFISLCVMCLPCLQQQFGWC